MSFGDCADDAAQTSGVPAVPGLALHTPPSLHWADVGFLAIPTPLSEIINLRISLPLAKVCGSLEKGKGSPKPRKHKQLLSWSLCRTCRDIPTVRNGSSEQYVPTGILLLLLCSSFVYPQMPRLLLSPRDLCWVISGGMNVAEGTIQLCPLVPDKAPRCPV